MAKAKQASRKASTFEERQARLNQQIEKLNIRRQIAELRQKLKGPKK